MRVGRMSACEPLEHVARRRVRATSPPGWPAPARQHVGGGRADRAGVAGEAGLGQAPVGEPALDAHAVAAERVHVLEGRVGRSAAAAEARAAPALADHVAVERPPRSLASSPRAPVLPVRRKAVGHLAREQAAVAERGELAVADRRSPARRRGSTRSNVVACENIPQVGMPSTGSPAHRGEPEQAARMRGRAVPLHARRPARSRPPKTGSSGSSALAPATIRRSAPSPRSASSSSATARARRRPRSAPAGGGGRTSRPSRSARPRSARAAAASRLSRAHRADACGAEAAHGDQRRPRPRRGSPRASPVAPAMASGVTLALATVSPALHRLADRRA